MPPAKCYASVLGDCSGKITDEHFISKALQRMFGPVTVRGFTWQGDTEHFLQPMSYAHGRVLCERHHKALNGLDGNAYAYFRNLMLIRSGEHLVSRARGKLSDIRDIDGRAFERWCLKLVCGAIATGNIASEGPLPAHWVRCLFEREPWPQEWALLLNYSMLATPSGRMTFSPKFIWRADNALAGIILDAFYTHTLFMFGSPIRSPNGLLRRPRHLRVTLTRADGGPPLDGMTPDEPIYFAFRWPADVGPTSVMIR